MDLSCAGHACEPVVDWPPGKNLGMAQARVLVLSCHQSFKRVVSCYHDYMLGFFPSRGRPPPLFGPFSDKAAGDLQGESSCPYSFSFPMIFHLQGADFHHTNRAN